MIKNRHSTVWERGTAFLLTVLMIISLIPVGAFATEKAEKIVTGIVTEGLPTELDVSVGTAKEDLGLPAELTVQVAAATEEAPDAVSEETASVDWQGDYTPDTAGEYLLTAAFTAAEYSYNEAMPSVTIRVTAPAETGTPAADADADDNAGEDPDADADADADANAAEDAAEDPGANNAPDAAIDDENGDEAGIMLLGDAPAEINLVDINAITKKEFKVKPKGQTDFISLPLPAEMPVYVGDEVYINFAYSQINNASADTIYYFNIPEGLNAVESMCRGEIKSDSGETVGNYCVNGDRVELTFNEDYLDDHGNTVDEGTVFFYGTLDEDALTNEGVIKLGDIEIGKVPIVPDPEITKANVKKWNGDGTVEGGGIKYDPVKKAVQYTFEVTTDATNNKVIDSIDVTDTLTTTVNGNVDNSIVTGNYTDINITPAGSATFTKVGDNYVLHAANVAAGASIKVSYWVPVKDGIVQANFVNDVDANKTVGTNTSLVGSSSVQGKINNTLQINKTAENPVYHVEEDAKTTTVTYKVSVTAPGSNTTDIANAYVEDIYELGGDLVTGISGFSTTSENVSYNNDFATGAKPKFTVELGTMKPGDTKEFTYTAVLDTDKCYMQNSNSNHWLDNYAYAKSGDFTFDKSKGSRNFKKEFTKKTGIYDPISGAYKFTVVFNGVLPDTPENADLTDPKYYYNGVLDFLDDEIQTKGKGFHYVGTPAPTLEAYRGPEGSAALQTATLDGTLIDGKESFHLAVPQNMKGAYSYRLTYYVNLPADAQQTDVVKNQYSVTLKGIGNGGTDQTFHSSASVSSAAAGSNALNKSLSNAVGERQVLETETGHESEYATQMYTVKISSPIVANATLEDTVTDGDIFGIDLPSDYLQQNLVIKQGNKVFANGTDYRLESINNKSFKVTFLKAVTDASATNPVTVTYKGQLKVTDAGKEFAETPNNVNNLNPSAIKNSATLNNGNLGPVTKSVDLEPTGKIVKKAVNAQELGGAGNDLVWDIKPSFDWVYCAFGLGYHNLVDTIPADQELVKVEHFTDNETPTLCPEGADKDHGYDVVENADGTTTVTIRASAGRCNHHETYRIWTRIKASVLSDQGINPDNFDNYTFTNSAYYEANGAQWKVAADQTVSNHRFSKETEYGATTEALGGVKFTLKVNTDGADLNGAGNTITVHDTMNPQLVLKEDSLLINGKPITQITGARLEYSGESNKFDLILPDNTPFEITYIAEIDAEQGDSGWLSNEASIDGRVDTVTVDRTNTARLEVGAGASSKLAFFLKKTDVNGNLLKQGVAFSIAKVTGAETTAPATAMTNQEDGTFKYRGVEKDSIYVLTETQTPDTFKTSKPIYIAFGTPDAALKSALEAKGITIQTAKTGGGADLENMFVIKNEDTTIDIPVEKVWDDNNDESGVRPTEIIVNLTGKVEEDTTGGDQGTTEPDPDGGDEGGGLDIEALDDGNEHASLTLNAGNNWKKSFENLPTHKSVIDPETGELTRKPITYTIEEQTVNGYTTNITGSVEDGFTITNHRDSPANVTLPLSGVKKLTGPDGAMTMTAGQFSFTLSANASNPANGATLPQNVTVTVDQDGKFSFDNITFTKVGTYLFTVSEENGGAAGYVYDQNPVTVKVVIENDTVNNKLVVKDTETSYTKNGNDATAITFENTYTAPAEATMNFNGIKTLKENGQDKAIEAGQFKFTVTEGNNNPAAITGLPTGEMSVSANGGFSIGALGFAKAGNYTFTVSEVNSGATGYTYDANDVTVDVKVVLDTNDNTLKVDKVTYTKGGNEATGISFDNTYTTPVGATMNFNGTKTLKENGQDKAIEAGQFKFTVTEGNSNPAAIIGLPTGEMSVSANGGFSLGTLSFAKAGNYTFTVSEVNGGAAGYTYDAKDVTVNVKVALNPQTNKLEVDSVTYTKGGDEATGISFDNTYTTPAEASMNFNGTKTLKENGQDKAIEPGQFKFIATEGNSNPAAITGLPEGEMSVDANGGFSIGTLSFDKAGNYTFTVSEVNEGAAGYTYDAKDVTVNVKVVLDTTNNTLKVDSVTYIKDGDEATGIAFDNTYTTPAEASMNFNGTKTLKENGQDKAIEPGQFKFTVTEGTGNPAAITGLPEGEMSVDANGGFSLGTLSFAKAGNYTFTVSEVDSGAAGYSYDAKDVTVEVKVVLNTQTNELEVDKVTYTKGGDEATEISFDNTYTTPAPAKLTLDGTKTLKENGQDKDIEAGQFKFTVTEGTGNPAAITGLPTGEMSVDANGGFSLGEISFSKAGTYVITVSEVNSGAAGYTYDDKAVVVTIPVTLKTDDNTLVVGDITYKKGRDEAQDISFENTYATPTGASMNFDGIKTLKENGQDKAIEAGQFLFRVTEDENNPAAIAGLPTGDLFVGVDGSFSLGTLSFNKAGSYTFTVSEVDEGAAGYTYDAKDVTVDVEVVLNTQTNELEVDSVTYTKGNEDATEIAFDNTYTTPDPAELTLDGTKTLKENGQDKAMEAGQFKFTVTEGTGNPAAITGLPTGNISVDANGGFSLGTLSFTKAGTYTFVVSEVDEGAAGYTYDNKAVSVKVEVVLNTLTNKLEVESTTYTKGDAAARAIAFDNTYTTPNPVDLMLTGVKTLTENGKNKAIAAGQFKFLVTEGAGNPAAIVGLPAAVDVAADGTIQLGKLSFAKAGVYTFTVTEQNDGAEGYVYDTGVVTVTANVVLDTRSNTLVVAEVKYTKNGYAANNIEFVNTYNSPKDDHDHDDDKPDSQKPETGKDNNTNIHQILLGGHAPKTGDSTNSVLWVVLIVVALAGIVGCLLVQGSRDLRSDEGEMGKYHDDPHEKS